MASFFDFVKAPSLQKFKYDLSHEVKFSGRVGDLIPFNWEFLSPGDSVQLNSAQFVRTAPLVHPIYQRLNVDVHHFFIPLRLIWEDFETFITGYNQKSGGPNDITNHPKIILDPAHTTAENLYMYLRERQFGDSSSFGVGSLADYLGVPVQELALRFGIEGEDENGDVITDGTYEERKPLDMSILPFRAYQQVYNDYYRDSIKEEEIFFMKGSNDQYLGDERIDDEWAVYELRQRALGKDYFTTSQPTPQLGEDVTLNSPNTYGLVQTYSPAPSTDGNLRVAPNGMSYVGPSPTPYNRIYGNVDIPSAVITTINKLRELFSIQKWKDQGNKFGSRYKEQVLGHFGVDTPDARLQRAQFLGGGRVPLMINQVSQLSAGSEDSPLGYQAGQGMASGADNYFEYDVREHGIMLSIISVLPENTYFRGLPKKFKLYDRFDFPFPEFATLGEQEVKSEEYNIHAEDDQTFGYQERYSEFKTIPNRACGEFRTNLRDFFMASPQSGLSCLDDLRVNPIDYDNVFAVEVTQADNLYFLIMNDFTKYSPLPYINRVTTDYV